VVSDARGLLICATRTSDLITQIKNDVTFTCKYTSLVKVFKLYYYSSPKAKVTDCILVIYGKLYVLYLMNIEVQALFCGTETYITFFCS